MEGPAKLRTPHDSFRQILILLLPIFLLSSIVNAQEMTAEEMAANRIEVMEDTEQKTFTIMQGQKVKWRKAKLAMKMGDCYLILTSQNEKILINSYGEKRQDPHFYRCVSIGNWDRNCGLEDSAGWYYFVEYFRSQSHRPIIKKVIRLDSLPKEDFQDVYFYNHQKKINIYNYDDRVRELFKVPSFESIRIVEKDGRKGIWFQGSLDWYDEVFFRKGFLFRVEKNGLVGFYKITPIHYKTIEDFDLGLARFTMKDGKTGYVDMKGNEYFD
jgi:hypothetical protein